MAIFIKNKKISKSSDFDESELLRVMQMLKEDWVLVVITCILCVIFMVPRILSAQFGLLDDGVLLSHAQAAVKDPNLIWYQYDAVGRFLPTALLIRAFIFSLAGFSAELWYIGSTVQLILTTLILFFIARKYQASRLQIALSVLIFLASPTLVENFYTLSKSEIPLLLFAAGAILCASYYPSLESPSKKIFIITGTFVLLLLTFGSKETAIVLPFMFLGWFVVSWIAMKKNSSSQASVQSDLVLFICSLVSCGIYWLLKYLLGITVPASSSYVAEYELFDFKELFLNFSSLLGWLIRDFPYLVPAFLGVILVKPLHRANTLIFAMKWILWLAVWAAILIPWSVISYYLLPFVFGAALLSGMVFGELIHFLGTKWTRAFTDPAPPNRKLFVLTNMYGLIALITLAGLFFIPPIINTSAFVIEQLSFDRANWRFVSRIATLPPNSRLIIATPEHLEYFFEIKLMVQSFFHRNDIMIEAYRPPIQQDVRQDTYIANLIFVNQILPSVRSIHGPTVMAWRACLENESVATHKVFSAKIVRPVIDIGLHRLLPLEMNSVLSSDRKIVESTTFTYGWEVVQFIPTKAHAVNPGVFKEGVFTLQTVSGNVRSINFGKGDETPLTGDLDGNGYSDLVLYDGEAKTWMVDLDLDGKADSVFTKREMRPGDIPLLGDWNGDGKVTPGFYRPGDGFWINPDNLMGEARKEFQLGVPSDKPLIGDWNGDGGEDIGVYRPETGIAYLITDPAQSALGFEMVGLPGATPVVGSWDATNRSQVALVQDNSWTIYIAVPGCILPNSYKEIQFEYSGIPLAGIWKD